MVSSVTDSPLLVANAAGAGAQAGSAQPAATAADGSQSFTRVLQSESSGAGASQTPAATRAGDHRLPGGNRLPPVSSARVTGTDTSTQPGVSAEAKQADGLPPRAAIASSNRFLRLTVQADAVAADATSDAGAIAPPADGNAVAEGAPRVSPDAGALFPDALHLDPALSTAGEQAVAADAGLFPPALAAPDLQTSPPRQLLAADAGPSTSSAVPGASGPTTASRMQPPALLSQVLETLPAADDALPRAGATEALPALTFDPLAARRAVAAGRGGNAQPGDQAGASDDGLRQLLASASQDRAAGAQRIEQALLAQAAGSGGVQVDKAALAASLQSDVEGGRQVARAADGGALIAGIGGAPQPAVAADQPGRPPPVLTLLATPADPEFAPELAGRLQMLVKNGVREANVQLHPAELGRLQLTVSTEGDQARMLIVAESAAARDMIEQSLPRLRDMLEQSGLQLAQGDVSERQPGSRDGVASDAATGAGPPSGAETASANSPGITVVHQDRLLDAYA